jgi:hypothetical protein
MLVFCHGCGHGGHQKCYGDFYKLQPPVNLSAAPKHFPFVDREKDRTDNEHRPVRRARSAVHGLDEDESRSGHTIHRREISAPGVLSRGRRRDTRREAEETDSSIPEMPRQTVPARDHSRSSEKMGPSAISNANTNPSLSPHPHPNPHPNGTSTPSIYANTKRTRSEAETSTIVEEDSGIPDEEYMLVREKEVQNRVATMAELKLLARRCAAGCGHMCWMTRM